MMTEPTSDAVDAEVVTRSSEMTTRPRPSILLQFIGNRKVLLILLYAATLFLGLPALWVSPVFTRNEKVVHTFLVCVWSALVLAGFYVVMAWAMGRIQEAMP
jgi:hypothetical protein